MAKQQSTGAYIARLTLTLLIIAAVCAGLLGLVNAITEEQIAILTEQKTQASMHPSLLFYHPSLPTSYDSF